MTEQQPSTSVHTPANAPANQSAHHNLAETAGTRPTWSANLAGLDYAQEARAALGKPPVPIYDAHAHIAGARAAAVYADVCQHFHVAGVSSQTRIEDASNVRNILADRVRFVAIPDYSSPDRAHAQTNGFIESIRRWRGDHDARLVKFWNAPRLRDFAGDLADDIAAVDAPWRRKVADEAMKLGYAFMCHIADPDTWFATKYADPSRYGSKADQYKPLERMLREYPRPWLLAHMAGWPEDLDFLDQLLSNHSNAYIDTSATKWIVRELSKHTGQRVRAFLDRWKGRVLFGSDIVTSDDHLEPDTDIEETNVVRRAHAQQASSRDEAFDLYASRYWAMRTLFETNWSGKSPIADPDLAMVDPMNHDEMSSPPLKGVAATPDQLSALYSTAAESFFRKVDSGECIA